MKEEEFGSSVLNQYERDPTDDKIHVYILSMDFYDGLVPQKTIYTKANMGSFLLRLCVMLGLGDFIPNVLMTDQPNKYDARCVNTQLI